MKIPLTPPPIPANPKELGKILSFSRLPLVNGRYLHWDQVRHRQPPEGLTHEQWWAGIKIMRNSTYTPLPLLDKHGRPIVFSTPNPVIEKLHIIDTMGGGQIQAPKILSEEGTQDRHLISSLVEEAIESSKLEGAATTRSRAKSMLRYGQQPQTKHERMIYNNYLAVKKISEMRGEPLTVDAILDLHKTLVDGTMAAEHAGRFQTPDEERVVVRHKADGLILHEPPDAAELPARLGRLVKFLTAPAKQGQFIHPIIKAIIAHFQLAYDHPFADGNGRAARGLFYWVALNNDYWVLEFASISSILRRAPAKYTTAFLYTETDANDLTYFIDYQLSVIVRALKQLEDYIRTKAAQIRDVEEKLRNTEGLNYRQLALLSHAVREPETVYTAKSHQNSHGVAYNTARADLMDLVKRGFLVQLAGRGSGFAVEKDKLFGG